MAEEGAAAATRQGRSQTNVPAWSGNRNIHIYLFTFKENNSFTVYYLRPKKLCVENNSFTTVYTPIPNAKMIRSIRIDRGALSLPNGRDQL